MCPPARDRWFMGSDFMHTPTSEQQHPVGITEEKNHLPACQGDRCPDPAASTDRHRNLERKALPTASFSGEEGADLWDFCRRAGASPAPLHCAPAPPPSSTPEHKLHRQIHLQGDIFNEISFQF